MSDRRRVGGLSLIEVVVFIVVLGIGIAGIVALYNQVTRASVDPLVRKQTLALAASLLEEIELRGFTLCDPDDPNVMTGTTTGCTAGYSESIGPDTNPAPLPVAAETRYASPFFDHVNDYHNFSMAGAGIRSADGTNVTGLADYSVSVAVANAGGDFGLTADHVLLITVTATHTTGLTVSLQGYRFRYAPDSP